MTTTPAAEAFWQAYVAHAGPQADGYEVATFGDSAEMADALLELVVEGTKRATASLVRNFEAAGEPLPRIGGHAVALDADGTPVLIWRTVDVRIGPLVSCDAAFAWDEGEGDRTLADWLDGHRRYFERQAQHSGFTFDETTTPVVFERFRVVWPMTIADR